MKDSKPTLTLTKITPEGIKALYETLTGKKMAAEEELKVAKRMKLMTPPGRANYTAHWAITMTKVLISKLMTKTKWNLITFAGPKGGEARGIVDLMAVRKDHHKGTDGLNRGDIFEIVLFQVKGGNARRALRKRCRTAQKGQCPL